MVSQRDRPKRQKLSRFIGPLCTGFTVLPRIEQAAIIEAITLVEEDHWIRFWYLISGSRVPAGAIVVAGEGGATERCGGAIGNVVYHLAVQDEEARNRTPGYPGRNRRRW